MIQNKQKYFQKYSELTQAMFRQNCLWYFFVSVVHQETINPLGGVRVLWFSLALCHLPCVSLICDRSLGRRVEGTGPLCTPLLNTITSFSPWASLGFSIAESRCISLQLKIQETYLPADTGEPLPNSILTKLTN